MTTLSMVITQDGGHKEIFDLSPAQSKILKEQLCMGTCEETDLKFLAGSNSWATKREGLCSAELVSLRRMFELLRRNFASK